jgi:hypothetical protein
MGAKELDVLIFVIQKRYDQTPSLWQLLHIKQLLLQSFEVFR